MLLRLSNPKQDSFYLPQRFKASSFRNMNLLGLPWWSSGKESAFWASLVAQWLGVCLPVQGTRVRALVREDPTCCRAAEPVRHNY